MQKIRIDFDNPGLPQHISAVENDSQSRFFQATLYENGKAYTAPEGAAYSIMYRGFGPQNQGWYDTINDGAGKRAACAVSGNVVTCEIARQALQVPGHVSIVLCVTTGKGYMVKSWPIECDCKNDRYDSTAEIQSFFYITQVSNADWNRAIQALEDLKNIIDPTLSLSGKAADAKVTGDKIAEIKEDIKSTKDLTLVETENLWSTSNVIKNAELNSSGEIFFPSGTLWSVYDAFIPAKEDDGEAYLVRGFTNYDSANIDTVDNENLGLVMDVFWAYYDESYKFIAKKRQTPMNRLTIFTVPGSGVWYKAKADGISTRPVGTKYIKIQFKTAALNYGKIDLRYIKNWSDEYTPHMVNLALKYAKQVDADAKKYAENIVNEGENIPPFKYTNGVTTLIDDLTVLSNGMYFDHYVANDRCKLVQHFSHDSTLVEVNGKLYCAYVGNKTSLGDSPSYEDAYTALAIVDTANFGVDSAIVNLDVAKKGDSVGSKSIISGVGVPNCIAVSDDVIRIFFSAKLSDGIYYLFYRDFLISSESFSDIKYCYFTVDEKTYIFSTPSINDHIKQLANIDYFISMNAQISKSQTGEYFCGVCVESYISNSLIFKTSDLETFDFWVEPPFTKSSGNFEGACACAGQYLYYALRQKYDGYDNSKGRILVAKIDINSKNIIDEYEFVDSSSRACWFFYGENLYLIHQIDNRKRMEIVKIDKSNLCLSKTVCISAIGMVYPSFVLYDNGIYISSTGASSTSIYIRKAPAFEKYTCDKIQSKLISALYINKDWEI